MSVQFEKIVEEDLNLGTGTVDVTMPAGGTATGHKINQSSFVALAASATAPGSQSVAASTLTVVQLTLEDFDTQSWFNTGTYRWVPQKAGYYQINGYAAIASMTGTFTVGIYKNGTLVSEISQVLAAAVGKLAITAIVQLDGSTDYVELEVTHTDTTAKVISAARMSAVNVGGL